MAESESFVATLPESAQSVQEISETVDEVPVDFICANIGDYGPIDLCVPLAEEIPIIDMVSMETELLNLRFALTSWGCFHIVKHGIEDSLVEQLRDVSDEFFHLPSSEKQRYARPGDEIEGYGNDMILFDNQRLDWMDRLLLTVNPQNEQKLQFWPHNPPSFRSVLEDYTSCLRDVLDQLVRSIARSLSLPEDCFTKQFGENPVMLARFNYYPPCSRPDAVHGQKPHADISGVTFLLLDKQVQGLQVHKDGQWLSVPAVPGALFVNLGDQLEIMSNGVLKSPVHRVVTNSNSERMTIAVFCSPSNGQEIGPVDELVSTDSPRMYKNVTDYSSKDAFQFYQRAKRPIDVVRI